MAKSTTSFVCRSCGGVQTRWMGKCPDCGQWDSLDEFKAPAPGASMDKQRGSAAQVGPAEAPQATPIESIDLAGAPGGLGGMRMATGLVEFDRVLGGASEAPEFPATRGGQSPSPGAQGGQSPIPSTESGTDPAPEARGGQSPILSTESGTD